MKKMVKLGRFQVLMPFTVMWALMSCMEVSSRQQVGASRPTSSGGGLALNDPGCQSVALGEKGLFLTSQAADAESLKNQYEELKSDDNSAPLEVVEGSLEVFKNTLESGSGLTEQPDSTVVKLNYTIDGIPVCLKEVLVHKMGNSITSHGNTFNLSEEQLSVATDAVSQLDWSQATPNESVKTGCAAGVEKGDLISECPKNFDIYEESRCVSVSFSGEKNMTANVRPFLEISFDTSEGSFYTVANNNEALVIEKRSFTAAGVSGTGTVFQRIPSSRGYQFQEKSVKLNSLSGSGYLCSPRFLTDTAFTTGGNGYVFPGKYPGPGVEISDFRKYEVTMFHNAQIHSDWIRGLTFSSGWTGQNKGWIGPQIRLYIMPSDGGVNNKAEYKPRFGETGAPAVLLGNGDNKSLRNLLVDPEVISHELGHHVVFKNLKSTSGQALDMHEGLADAFVFLRTKDPCLAESICPSTRTCISSQCLRTAKNSYVYQADIDPTTGLETYKSGSTKVKKMKSGHLKSQLISGFMWDIGQAMGYEKTAILLLRAVSFLVENGDYSNLMSALKDADRSLFQGSYYCPVIKKAAQKRSMDEFLPPDSCSG